MRPIIDSHLDLGWNAMAFKRNLTLPLAELNHHDRRMPEFKGRGRATVSLPELQRGSIGLCFATLMARVPYADRPGSYVDSLDYPTHDMAYAYAQSQLAYYRRLHAQGHLRIICTAQELDEHWQQWTEPRTDNSGHDGPPIGALIAMEGSDGVVNSDHAATWYRDGLRCASLVHYGKSAYAAGTGEEGPLTESGCKLLREFERLGIMLDVTHLCDTSFFEAMDAYSGPVLASHQNCRELVPHQRQFSDEQLRIVIERDGVIGTAADAWMLFPDYNKNETSRDVVNVDALADHMDHVCQLAGNSRHAAFGSDLDGGFGTEQCPTGLDSIADLQKLDAILSSRGYSNDDIDAVFHGNWLRLLRRSLPS